MDKSNWANMEKDIWAGVMNDLVVAASPRPPMARGIPLQTPKLEKPVASVPPSASEPEGMTSPQDLALVPRRQPPPSPGFSPQVLVDLILPALEGAYLPGAPTLFDLSTLQLLEMIVSHTPAMGEVHYRLEAQNLARITLPDTSTWRYLGPSSREEED